MLALAQGPHALVLTPADARDPVAAAAAIAGHFRIDLGAAELAPLIEEPDLALELEDADIQAWLSGLSERERAIVDGALQPYIDYFAGERLDRLTWEPELFYLSEEPIGSSAVPLTRPVDLTGRPRIVLFGPYINLPPGSWSADVVLGFSAETAGMSFLVEVFASSQLAQSRITAGREPVVEMQLSFTIENSVDQPVQIRVWTERSAFDGRLALGYVAITRQATIPDETRERLATVLQ
jgi:hypothetical protein